MNYYEVLDISQDADKTAVKRAYFSAVRKHSPDLDPEGFKNIRKAYETLSDDEKRSDYDSLFTADYALKNEFLFARGLLAANKVKEAVDYLAGLLKNNPDSPEVERLYAEALWTAGKSKTADNVCKKALQKHPNDWKTWELRAKIADSRGFVLKSKEYYEAALDVNPTNSKLWIDYFETVQSNNPVAAAKIPLDAMKVSEDIFAQNYDFYLYAAFIYAALDYRAYMETFYEKYAEYLLAEKKPSKFLFEQTIGTVAIFLDKSEKLLPLIEKVLHSLKKTRHAFSHEGELKLAENAVAIQKLKNDKRINHNITALTKFLLEGGPRNEQTTLESRVVAELPAMRKSIRALRENYPELFSLNKRFYNDALEVKKTEYMFEKYAAAQKKIVALNFDDEYDFDLDDDFEDEEIFEVLTPFVREEPKIGRNDPCPCGSGKKYKKCCGMLKII